VRAPDPKVYIGASTWGDATWNGSVFPPKTPSTKFRQLYPQYFTAVELNATHYKIYEPEVLYKWGQAAYGKDFKFCPKFPQEISHHSNFRNTEHSTAAFLHGVEAFGDNLGPVFLQLGENFSPAQKDALFFYLATLPRHLTFFLEARHPLWFASSAERDQLFETLRSLDIGAVITDTPGRRDVVHMHLTLPKVFLRFVSNGMHESSFRRTDEWIQQLSKWIDSGLEEAYVFLHPGEDAAVPGLASYWTKEVNRHCRLRMPDPTSRQKGLFDI
jgi:uncharacterized protein YecE (DUF72 family)